MMFEAVRGRRMLLNGGSVVGLAKDRSYAGFRGRVQQRVEGGRWESRHLVLKGNLLFVFRKGESDKQPLSLIIMENCLVDLFEDEDSGRPFVFQIFFNTSCQQFLFSTDTLQDLEEWVTVLATAGSNHLQLTVENLREQVRGTTPTATTNSSSETTTSSSSANSQSANGQFPLTH